MPASNPLAPARLRPPVDPDALAAFVWPAHAERAADGVVAIAGVPVTNLADRFGTPLYVVDEQDARHRALRIRTAFERAFAPHGASVRVYYAAKAFLSTGVARWMGECGLGIDVASGGELAVALAAGLDAGTFGMHGNNKSDAELAQAVRAGVGTIVIDALDEVDRAADAAAAAGVTQRVRLRVNSGVHASTHEYLATAREDQKFGVPLSDVDGIAARIRARAELEFVGLHSHIGSQIFEVAGFREAARRLLEAHARLLEHGDVPELNLGGGYGIAYTESDEVPPIEQLADALADAVQAECAALGIRVPDIAIEPGRSIIGPAGVTLYEVGTVKDVELALEQGGTAVRRYVSVDGGMSDNLRTALYGADYTVRLVGRAAASDSDPLLVRIAGKHCESGDIVVRDDYLPADVHRGDLVAVAATGAYCWSLASTYNHIGRPAVVAVRDGAATVLVHGDTVEDLLRRDAGYTPAATEEEERP